MFSDCADHYGVSFCSVRASRFEGDKKRTRPPYANSSIAPQRTVARRGAHNNPRGAVIRHIYSKNEHVLTPCNEQAVIWLKILPPSSSTPPPTSKDIVDTPLTANVTCSKHTRSRLVLNVLQPIYSSKYNIITSVASLLSVGDGKNSTQKKVRRRRTRCNYWPIKPLKTALRTVLPICSGASDPFGER